MAFTRKYGPVAPGRRLLRIGGKLWVVEPDSDTSLSDSEVLERHRDLVLDVCDRHNIPYFAIPEPNARQFRVGIAEEDWPALIQRLIELGRTQPLYLGVNARTKSGYLCRWAQLSVDPRIRRAAFEQSELEVFRASSRPGTTRIYDRPWACIVQKWARVEDGALRATGRNQRTQHLGKSHQEPVMAPQAGRWIRTMEPFTHRHIFEVDFPVDVVYMWVDGDDPQWQERKHAALLALGQDADVHHHGISDERFRDLGELRYSMRSLEAFAPWVRRVFLVTDRQVPSWLREDHPRLTVVDQKEIFGDSGATPSFNSHAIGARLHHISGLSEHYLHFNDDFFLGRAVQPDLFFLSNGMSKFFLSRSTLDFSDARTALPHEQARRNVVEILRRDFGRSPTQVFFHTPIAQRRSTMFELEERYPQEFEATWNSQFRNGGDYEVNSWMHHFYGYLNGSAVPGRIRYDYFSLDDDAAWVRMRRLARRRDVDAFCVNDASSASVEQRARAAGWLERYFPAPSSLER